MQTSKISLRSFRSQGDQREHSDTADRYLFSSDRIQLRFNRFSLILKSKKTKQKNTKGNKSCAIICTDIHLQALCKLFQKQYDQKVISQSQSKTLQRLFKAK